MMRLGILELLPHGKVGGAAVLAIMNLAFGLVAPSSGWTQGGLVNLTNNDYSDLYPTWSPDGTKIAFSSKADSALGEIYVMDANGDNRVRLTQNGVRDSNPAWSPDGTKIAFSSNLNTYYKRIYVMDANGDNPIRLTLVDRTNSPEWSPDGGKIAFMTYNRSESRHEIHVMDANGDNRVSLTRNDNYISDSGLTWSPDGTKIAFVREMRDRRRNLPCTEIHVMDANGDNPVQLTRSIYTGADGRTRCYNAGGPAWSPDGTKIAFGVQLFQLVYPDGRLRGLEDGLYVMDANGDNNPVKLTPLIELSSSYLGAAWSPDGTRIAFHAHFGDDDSEIYVIPSGSAAPTPMEHDDTRERATAVGPDSTTPGALERAGDVDYFRVDVPRAGRLTVGTSGATDTVGYLQNQEGRHLAGNDDAGPEGNFEIVREVESGTYYVAVFGGEGRTATGAYSLQVRFTAGDGGGPATDHGNTRAEAAPVGVNTRTSAALERAGDVDYFRVEITQAGSLVVETTGTTDTFGYVGGASGGWLAQNDDGGTASNFRITRDVMAGTYYVAVVGYNRTATGAYTLAVRFTGSGGGGGGEGPAEHGNSRAQATRVAVDTNTTGALERAGDIDYFRVEVPAAGQLRVATRGDTDTFGYFGGADGRWLSQNDDNGTDVNFRIVRQVPAGTYYVAVVGGEGRTATGAYTFHVRFTADGAAADHGDTRERATRVEVNTQTGGALDRAGDVDYFRVAVPRAGRLTVETTGTTDTFGYVGGVSGGWLAQDDDGGTERNFRIARDVAAGTYYVAVAGFNRTATGPYMLAVRFAAP